MAYKSPCKACDHLHEGMICNCTIYKTGTIRLKSFNSSLWGVSGGTAQGYDSYSGSQQMVFKPFQTSIDEPFEYNQQTDCGCRFYIPSDNLEYLEWKYNESTTK